MRVGNDSLNFRFGINGVQFSLRCDGLGHILARIHFVEKYLALKITLFHVVAIHYAQRTHSGSNQGIGLRGAQRSTAHNHGFRAAQLLLPFNPNGLEKDLARVLFVVLHSGSSLPVTRLTMPKLWEGYCSFPTFIIAVSALNCL